MDASTKHERPPPTHTPYDGSSKLFTIGLKPLDLDKWIEVDEHLIDHLAEKRRLYAEIPDKVFVEENGTRDAQREVRDLIEAHLLSTFPKRTGKPVPASRSSAPKATKPMSSATPRWSQPRCSSRKT